MHKSAWTQTGQFFRKYAKPRDRILEVGSKVSADQVMNPIYRNLFAAETMKKHELKYVGMDIEDGVNVDLVVEDPYVWREIPDNDYNIIVCGQVLEHVEFFWLVFKEMARVLKSGGFMCVISPAVCHIHQYPVDCWRFLPDGMKALARYAKIRILEAKCTLPANRLVDEKINDCIGIFQKP